MVTMPLSGNLVSDGDKLTNTKAIGNLRVRHCIRKVDLAVLTARGVNPVAEDIHCKFIGVLIGKELNIYQRGGKEGSSFIWVVSRNERTSLLRGSFPPATASEMPPPRLRSN